MQERNIKVHVAAIGVNPDADKRARAVLEAWALEEKRIAIGSPQEAAFEKELGAISSALDTFDSKVLARFGGFTKAGQRYRELKDILARPAPHDIRIDTFEIWRSRAYLSGGCADLRDALMTSTLGHFFREYAATAMNRANGALIHKANSRGQFTGLIHTVVVPNPPAFTWG